MEDLAFSRSFRNWVLKKDAPEADYWENWVARHPDKAEMVKSARALIYAMHGNTALLSEEEVSEEVRKAVARLRDAPRYIPLEGVESRTGMWKGMKLVQRLWTAAALVAALALAGYFYYRLEEHPDVLRAFLNSRGKWAVEQQATDGTEDKTFGLPDESLVRLGKSSKIYFPKDRAAMFSRREVYLQGDAFFDVRKNQKVSFFVYSEQVVVKALGTSFTVHSMPTDNRASVTVATGNVAVYGQEDFYAASLAGRRPAGLMLTPNQEGIYDRGTGRWQRMLVGAPEPLKERPDSVVTFTDTPVRRVFDWLHDQYGVNFQYDGEAAERCRMTVQFGNESFLTFYAGYVWR